MAVVPLTAPYSLKTATLSLDADNFEAAVSDVTFTPSAATSNWTGISGNKITDVGLADWSVSLGFAQDLAEGSLLRYLHEHEGEQVPAVFTPVTAADQPGEGVAIEAVLILSAGTIGGTAGANIATSTATLGVVGKPAFSDPLGVVGEPAFSDPTP